MEENTGPLDDRWTMFVDIEGFSQRFTSNANDGYQTLRLLLEAIFRIGKLVYSGDDERLFAHQIGDSVGIISSFPETSPDRPIAIGIALIRHLISHGVAVKVAISSGHMTDVVGVYPTIVRDHQSDHSTATMASGLMTLQTVFGQGLINAYATGKNVRGCVLIVDQTAFKERSSIGRESSKRYALIDWIHNTPQATQHIYENAGLVLPNPNFSRQHLLTYLIHQKVHKRWAASTLYSVGLLWPYCWNLLFGLRLKR